jgi:uncharacterized protein (TIGR03067 family)
MAGIKWVGREAILLGLTALAVGVVVATHGRTAAESTKTTASDATRGEKKKLQGTWRMTAEEDHGRKLPEKAVRARFRIVIDGDRWTLKDTRADTDKVWTARLDPSTDPKRIDFTFQFGDNKGKSSLGIYRLTDDTLKLCLADPDESRPTKFEGTGQQTLLFFQRVESKP